LHVDVYVNVCNISSGCKLLGEIISGDEDEEGDEDNEEDEDAYMQKQREKLEAEKEAILNNKNLIAEVSLAYMRVYTYTHKHYFSGYFPVEDGLDSCPFDFIFLSPLVPDVHPAYILTCSVMGSF